MSQSMSTHPGMSELGGAVLPMSVLKDYEIEVLRALGGRVLSPEHIKAVVEAGTLADFTVTPNTGYFLTVAHPDLPPGRVVCHEPLVRGEAAGVTCGFVIFIENRGITIECHDWGEQNIPDDFREQDVRIIVAEWVDV